jgi:microcystin-dependent protein
MSKKLNHFADKFYVDKRSHQIGDIKYSVRSSDHGCWLKCDGRLLNQNDYPELFNIIGTTFGNNTEFRLPNCDGRVLGSSSSEFNQGMSVGNVSHSLSIDELPAHSHDGQTENAGSHFHSGTTDPSGSHSHISSEGSPSQNYQQGDSPSAIGNSVVPDHVHTFTTSANGVHNHSFITNSVGNNKEFSLMQPTLFVGNVFIYVKHD